MMNPRFQRLLHEALPRAAASDPGKPALVTEDGNCTYGELAEEAARLAAGLKRRGIGRGDRVVVYMENTRECALAVYGVLWSGGVMVVVNPQTRADKLAYIVEDSEASAVLTSDRLWTGVADRLVQCRSLRTVVCADGSQPVGTERAGSVPVESLDELLAEGGTPGDAGSIGSDLAALIYTSGSTGEPKGVMQTHQAMVFAAESVAEYLRLSKGDRILNVLPLSFDYGLYQLLMSVQFGATLVLEKSFAFPSRVLQRLSEEAVTVFPGVPTIFSMLKSLHGRKRLCFPRVRKVTNTAAALPPDFVPVLGEMFPRADIYAMYGLTECKRVSYLPPHQVQRKPGSVGRAIPGTEVMVLNSAGRPVAPGEVGTLHVRGPHVMAGYWRQHELTAEMLKPGEWPGDRVLCTHDRFTVDEEGDLYFVGRSDDIIKSRGEKVSPAEVEAVLYGVDGVRDAAVVGVTDPVLGEAICAFVSPMEDGALDAAALRSICDARLERFMVPQRFEILRELPRTANGKIDKQTLLQMSRQKGRAPQSAAMGIR